MGAEGYITVSRIFKGHELLTATMPIFRVTEPVGIIPAFRTAFAHLESACVEGEPAYLFCVEKQEVVLMTEDGGVQIGIVVLTLKEFDRIQQILGDNFPSLGSVNEDTLREAWKGITNGVWAITGYSESGTERYCRSQQLPKGIETDLHVTYEIWT